MWHGKVQKFRLLWKSKIIGNFAVEYKLRRSLRTELQYFTGEGTSVSLVDINFTTEDNIVKFNVHGRRVSKFRLASYRNGRKLSIKISHCTLIIDLYLQIRVLNATAARIPWTKSPNLSFSRQFLSLDAISVVRADFVPSTFEALEKTDKCEGDDRFIRPPWPSLQATKATKSACWEICQILVTKASIFTKKNTYIFTLKPATAE